VFLQHGIAINDYSENIHRYKTNFSLFITSSKVEYNSFLELKYGYDSNIVRLTGLSRFDNLERIQKIIKKEKLILIIPTFRNYIRGTVMPITYESVYNELFKYTDYFKFYNNLINDNRLIEAMKKYNYKGIFSLHPCFSSQWKDFTQNSLFTILSSIDYQKMFAKASLLITDYSSVFFDFAYLKKLVIFTQFDYEDFRAFHYKKSNFDYIKDGLGPVCRDYEASLNTIIKSLKNDCRLPDIYLRRIKKFYAFFDEHNNDRIYQAIKQIGHPIRKNKFTIYICIFIEILCTLKSFLLMLNYFKNNYNFEI
jgi:CDP-glycerol glycerophosphotransferase (TagB/SpsB family)